MNEAETVTLSEIVSDTGSESRQIFLQTKLKDGGNEGFDLTVLDGSRIWEGRITEQYLDQQCEALKMDFNTYVNETTTALTKAAHSDMAFECIFKTINTSSGQLTWKKIPAKSIKFNLGSVDLKVTKAMEKLASVLSQCIATTQAYQNRITSLETDNERLTQERQNALKRLDKCVTAKDELEKDLYSKFVAVLNSKKQRIKELEENHVSQSMEDDMQRSVSLKSSPVPSTSRTNVSVNNQKTRNSSNQSPDGDTKDGCYDNDTDEESPPPKKKQTVRVTSRQSMKLESSLNLGEDEEQVTEKAPVVRRARRQPATKKETPAKPILPRVSSVSSADRDSVLSPRRPSLRKSGSGKSNKSSDNLDPDDLMDDF